ncbi:MAG: hypothetical protein EZS28_003212 [Streblomastix strix]|uniref:Uncharacterized protein n=1 Tax=Streblomastix strix TaxID=222440 RepID=A0A5J4X3B9_9EUKA|nr:MAG: hypothetical protein EZS28_003212 [Streblomastix strix]
MCSIDETSTVTGLTFIKSGVDDAIVLLGAGEVDSKLSNYVNTANDQEINGTKTFNANLNATGFVKTGKDNTSILLTGGGDALILSFGGLTLESITYTRPLVIQQAQIYMTSGTGNDATSIPAAILATQAFKTQDGLKELQTVILSINISAYYNQKLLFDAAGLSDFSELQAYIKERYPKPIGELLQPVPIGDQTLQQQVKNNDDIIYASNEVFEPPVPNTITKLDLSSQLER